MPNSVSTRTSSVSRHAPHLNIYIVLKQTIESHLPYFNELESKNQQLQIELASKQRNARSSINSTVKLRELEEKWAAKQAIWDRERRRMFEENK